MVRQLGLGGLGGFLGGGIRLTEFHYFPEKAYNQGEGGKKCFPNPGRLCKQSPSMEYSEEQKRCEKKDGLGMKKKALLPFL